MYATLKRVLIAFGIGVVLYGLAGFLLVPRFVRSAILDNLESALAVKPTIESVSVNPFTLSLTVNRFTVPDPSGAVAASFEKLYLRFNVFSPLFRAWTFDELRLERPQVRIAILEDRSLNLVGLLRPAIATADSAGKPPAFLVRRLRVVDGTASYEDLTRQPSFRKELLPIQIELKDFTTRRDRRNAYSLNAKSARGEAVTWSGRFSLKPFASDGRIRVEQVQAESIEEMLGGTAPYQVTRGTLALAADYRFDAAETPPRFDLSDMAISIRDLALSDRESGEEAFTAVAIESKDGAVRSDLLDASLGTVNADSAHAVVWMDSTGMTNFERWSQAPADSAAPWITRIALATLQNAEVVYEDRRLDPPAVFQLSQGRVELKGFSSAPGAVVPVSVACALGAGAQVTAEGSLSPSAGSIDLQLYARGFDLWDLQPYLSATTKLDITGGTADAKGRLRFNSTEAAGPRLRFSGDVTSSRFACVDRKVWQEFLSWERLELKGVEYDLEPPRMFAREIVATKPFVRFLIAPDLTNNVQAMAVPPDSVPAAFRRWPGDPDTIPATIQVVRIVGGSMYFADLSLEPTFATGIEALNGTVRDITSSRAAHAVVELAGQVDEGAPARFSGTINPLNGRGVTDLAVTFQNLELTSFTPYAGKFMGYRIQKGAMDLDLRYRVRDRQLSAENRLVMRQLALGEKVASADATTLPVKLAVALLKNRDGAIDLNLPIHGSLDDPAFSVLPVFGNALRDRVADVVASPFKLFGAPFDSGGAEAVIRFPYGSTALDAGAFQKLDAIRKGLADRPGLKLEIEPTGFREGDSLALTDLHMAERLRDGGSAARLKVPEPAMVAAAALRAPAGFTAMEYAQLLASAYASEFGKLPALEKTGGTPAESEDAARVAAASKRLAAMEDRLRSTIRVGPDELSGVAVARARKVRDYLLRDATLTVERVLIVSDKGSRRPDSAGVCVGLTLTD